MLKQELLLLVYNKDVVCIIDKGGYPICQPIESPRRRFNNLKNVPSHDPYIPRPDPIYYKCTKIECYPIKLHSITQVASPELNLKSCYAYDYEEHECETIRYHYFKNVDKLLFLSNTIPDKTFYLVDCLVYADGGRVCHKKDDANSHKGLVDTGTIARPNELNILSQDEFICEENNDKEIRCDLNPYIPFNGGLERKKEIWTCSALAALDGYSPQQDPDQFHIQTDEDDERYFLYQTHNGQYRKERRLKDGSVVGTTGWVGADGFLRLQDYIADDQGYRIYKSKTVYVGLNRPIGESIKIAKTAPTDSGFGVTPAPPVHRTSAPARGSTTAQSPLPSPSTTHKPPQSFPDEVSITPSTPSYVSPSSTPRVEVSPNSIDSSTSYNLRPTVPPITADDASPSPNPYDYENTNTIDDHYYASDSTPYRRYDIFNPNSYRHADAWTRRYQQSVRLGDGYTPQFAGYDGVAYRRNGFRYYLPKQYHEEATQDTNERIGSFGYVDPFGIRRVIYYNTSPDNGFQIRKNNRYVGHDATPYDPRPIHA